MKSIPMKPTLSALLMAGLLGVSGQAAAVAPLASATIDWSSFEVTLFDLAPLDGIAPSITFSDKYSYVWAGSVATSYYEESMDWTTAISAVSGPAQAAADGSALMAMTWANGWAYSEHSADFSLTPMTLAVFSASGAIATVGGYSHASIGMEAWGPGADGSGYQDYHGYMETDWDATLPDTQSGKVTASFLNLSGASLNGTMTAYASVSAPVPEPETYAMMLAGLGLLGWMVRRRKA